MGIFNYCLYVYVCEVCVCVCMCICMCETEFFCVKSAWMCTYTNTSFSQINTSTCISHTCTHNFYTYAPVCIHAVTISPTLHTQTTMNKCANAFCMHKLGTHTNTHTHTHTDNTHNCTHTHNCIYTAAHTFILGTLIHAITHMFSYAFHAFKLMLFSYLPSHTHSQCV